MNQMMKRKLAVGLILLSICGQSAWARRSNCEWQNQDAAEREADLNRQIGELNAELVEFTGRLNRFAPASVAAEAQAKKDETYYRDYIQHQHSLQNLVSGLDQVILLVSADQSVRASLEQSRVIEIADLEGVVESLPPSEAAEAVKNVIAVFQSVQLQWKADTAAAERAFAMGVTSGNEATIRMGIDLSRQSLIAIAQQRALQNATLEKRAKEGRTKANELALAVTQVSGVIASDNRNIPLRTAERNQAAAQKGRLLCYEPPLKPYLDVR